MITLELNGKRVEAETEKEARKQLRQLVKQEKKDQAERDALHGKARSKAESNGYRLLCRIASGDQAAPCGWKFYTPGAEWSQHLFDVPAEDSRDYDGNLKAHIIKSADGDALLNHYGNKLVGAVCGGAGFCTWLFLQESGREAECYAVGVENGTIALVPCPNVTIDYFRQAQ